MIGASLKEILDCVPADDLHIDVRRDLFARICRLDCYGPGGRWFPSLQQIVVGFDGRVVVEVSTCPDRRIGHPESGLREAFAEAREAASAQAANGEARLRERLMVPADETAFDEQPLGALVSDLFPDRALAWRAALRKLRARAPLPLADHWEDVLVLEDRASDTYRRHGAYQHLNTLIGEARDADARPSRGPARFFRLVVRRECGPGTFPRLCSAPATSEDPARDAPAVVARMQLVRERPLSSWPATEIFLWPSIRRARASSVVRRRGLVPLEECFERAEWYVEQHLVPGVGRSWPPSVDRRDLPTSTRWRHVAWLAEHAGGRHLPARHAQWRETFPNEDYSATLQAASEVLSAHGFPALAIWVATCTEPPSPLREIRERWLRACVVLDDELSFDDLARLMTQSPTFAPPTRQALHDAEALIAVDQSELARLEARPAAPVFSGDIAGDFGLFVEVSDDVGPLGSALFRDDVAIGRLGGQSLHLASPDVDRRHGSLRIRGDFVIVVDSKSRHGTFVDGRRVGAPQRVAAESVVAIGPYRLRVTLRR